MELALETTWPDLPLPKVNYNGVPRNTTLVSKRDAAYITRRSRFERTYSALSVSWCLTDDQMEAFETFFAEELDNGIAQFKIELRYPENTSLKEWAVRFDEGYTTSNEEGTWLVQASLDLIGPVQIPEAATTECPVTDGLIACFEALNLDGTSPVDFWRDVSGWEHHAVASPTAGSAPAYQANAFGSSPGVVFDGVDDEMDITCPVDVPSVTLFVVCSIPAQAGVFAGPINWRTAGKAGFHFNDARGNALHYLPGFLKTDSTGAFSLSKELQGGSQLVTFPLVYPVGPRLFVCRFEVDVALSYRYQGEAGAPNLDGYFDYSPEAKLGSVKGVNWQGTLGAVLVYNRALEDAEIVLVENYLNSRYPCF